MEKGSKPTAKDIDYDELLIIREDSGHGWRRKLRVVCFVINGAPRAPVIEARLYRDRDEHQFGRSVGLNFDEAKSLVENWDKVRSFWFGK